MRSGLRMISWCGVVAGITVLNAARADEPVPDQPEFNRDVRPILSDVCFHCHGPDAAQRQADLRFDTEAGATVDLGDGRRAVVAGKPNQSELVRRITTTEPELQMPPADSGRQLSPRQIAILKRWVEQGAKWEKHWSFLKPARPALPAVTQSDWIRSPIDAFVLARLERAGLTPSPESDKATLLRRVTLDLTGLPPSTEDVRAFLADDSPDAYERVVDRLLASSRYGERMAVRWMNGARYADTSGYQSDGERVMWRWRDWVIDAYNANQPFDQFTREQLAGDLLPNATLSQKIATGFNRNHRGNGEGGIIPEEYAVEYVVDRVETTSTVWLGLTVMCARCHTHKYDPITQTDFYRMFAFFNNVPEKGRALKYGNSPPEVLSPTRDQQQELDRRDAAIAAARKEWKSRQASLETAQAAWEKSGAKDAPADWSISHGLSAYLPFEGDAAARDVGPLARARPAAYTGQPRLTEVATEAEEKAYAESGSPKFAPGPFGLALEGDGTCYAAAGDLANYGFYDRFSFALWVKPQGEKGGTILSRMKDVEHGSGWCVVLEKGKVQLQLSQRYLDDACRAETELPLEPGRWQHLVVSYDGSREAAGIRFHIDGKPVKSAILLDELNQSFATKEPLRIGGGNGANGRFHGAIDELRIFDRVLADDEAAVLATSESASQIAAIPPARRSDGQAAKIAGCFLETAADASHRAASQRLRQREEERSRFVDRLPTTMIMHDMPTPRETHLLLRGEYDKPGPRVEPGVLESVAPFTGDAPRNRRDLAEWVIDRDNPLTARVAVNRLWQMLFGTGIVKTVDDFGQQGEWPSHPELLDWLAVEFQGASAADAPAQPPAWDVKRLLRLIVTSSTYRQSSRSTAALAQRDPENRLLARGPRFRLPAEMVRDQALAASGLLVERVGGPSVKPYQPEGLWKDLAGLDYEQDHGDSLYRRSLYTYWKRTIAPPAMITFDAAGRETCIVKESRTNTPLQALNLMNDVTYVEASRRLAERMMGEGGAAPADRIRLAFQSVLGRAPRSRELDVLTSSYQKHLAHYTTDTQAADALTRIGEHPRDPRLAVPELAACTAIASLVFNLDEAVTRE